MKVTLAAIASLLMAFASQATARDLGMFNGEPTPALAMYAAQTEFAADKCVSVGITTDAKGAKSFVKYFNRGIQLRLYKKKDPDFVINLESALETYAVAWNTTDRQVHESFCEGFSSEIAVKDEGFFRWFTPLNYFRYKFSPLSEASAARQKRFAGIASVAGAIVTTAATVSSGHDAVSSAKAGDWATSNQQMALSRNFNQLGGALIGAASAAPAGANDAASVLEEQSPEGATRVVRCPVVDHFFRFSEPADSPIWTTYQRTSLPCRDFMPSDLEPVE